MNTKHTPGTWFINTNSDECLLGKLSVESTSGYYICQVDEGVEQESNASLIAAAPETASERDKLKEINAELLEALDRANSLLAELTFTDWINGDDHPSMDIRQRIRNAHIKTAAAIAKCE